jgi:site-specific DNA-methyltransferase (cytosine-N4-specific)
MKEVENESIQLIITSPPYFNIKDYSLDGYQENKKGKAKKGQIGDINVYETYINEMLDVWKECFRVLKPNGKLIINTPLMPMLKKELDTHYNRHIFDINSTIQNSILNGTDFYLMDLYIWNRTNPTKKLMFGSYPYPRTFYAQNTIEFITVYVKDGVPDKNISKKDKDASKLTQQEWVEFTKQIWNIPIPNKSDKAFGIHSAIMPEEIVRRCVKLFSFANETILDPFTGSGTTLKVAQELGRNYIGYEISDSYKDVIDIKLGKKNKQKELSLK